MATDKISDLLEEIHSLFEQLDAATLEANFLQARIDSVLEELERRRGNDDAEIINEHTKLLLKNADAINGSLSKEAQGQIMDEAKTLLSKAASKGLHDDDVPGLERIELKLKQVTDLQQQLRAALVELLDEARSLNDRAEPKS